MDHRFSGHLSASGAKARRVFQSAAIEVSPAYHLEHGYLGREVSLVSNAGTDQSEPWESSPVARFRNMLIDADDCGDWSELIGDLKNAQSVLLLAERSGMQVRVSDNDLQYRKIWRSYYEVVRQLERAEVLLGEDAQLARLQASST